MEIRKNGAEGKQPFQKYCNARVNLISNLDLKSNQHTRAKLEAFAAMLCTEGEGRLYINNREVHITKNDLVVCSPGTLIEADDSACQFNICGFYLSKEFIEEINSIPTYLWNVRMYIDEHPVTHLDDKAGKLFCQYHELIASKLSAETPLKHHHIVTAYLLQAFMYEFHDTIESNVDAAPNRFTSGENLYKQFVELLIQSYPKSRSVAWYANQLNISPKYLSATCKTACEQTALKLIDRYVTEDVKRLLMRPEKTIKEIVTELGFPSISFFGKYVKKHLGMAPKFYRQQLCGNTENWDDDLKVL